MSLVSVVCYQVEVSASDRSLIQRSPTESDRESSIMRRHWPIGGLLRHGKKNTKLLPFLN